MEENLAKQIRECSRVKSKQPTWISELSDGQLVELFTRIKNGEPAKSIARHCQQIWAVRVKSTVHSLSQGILKFASRVEHISLPCKPPALIPPDESPPCSSESGNWQTKAPSPTSTLGSLLISQNLANQLRSRIQRELSKEESGGIPSPFLNKDIQALATLEKSILKMKDWVNKNPDSKELDELVEQKIHERDLKEAFSHSKGKMTPERLKELDRKMEVALKKAKEASFLAELITLEDGSQMYRPVTDPANEETMKQ